jgi:hypothetical protein
MIQRNYSKRGLFGRLRGVFNFHKKPVPSREQLDLGLAVRPTKKNNRANKKQK